MDVITNIFGIQAEYGKWNMQSSLPIYIAGSYEFEAEITETAERKRPRESPGNHGS